MGKLLRQIKIKAGIKMRDVVKNQSQPVRSTQRSRRKKRRNLSLYYLMIFIIVSAVGITLSLTVFFNIAEINVSGDSQYDKNQIIKCSNINIGDNLFRTNFKKSEEKILKELVYIDNVQIQRQFPDKLNIKVNASIEYANIEYDGGYLLISRKEKILDNIASPKEGLIVIKGTEPVITQKGEKFVSKDGNKDKLLSSLTEQILNSEFEKITQIDISDSYNVKLLYDNRITIELGTQSDLEYKIKYSKELVNEKIGNNKKGSLFMSDSKSNEASFVEEGDLKKYRENYNSATVTSQNTSETSSETTTSKTLPAE